MDFVYICRAGENEELRYSIRSVMANFPKAKIWVIGEPPRWYVGNSIFVKQRDTKYSNARNNLQAICDSSEINDNFVLMNDDFFIIKPIKHIENYHGGLLADKIDYYEDLTPRSSYVKSLQNTHTRLLKRGIENPLDYELHVPMAMNKAGLRASLHHTALWRSMYGNIFGVGGKQIKDVKIYYNGPLTDKNHDYKNSDLPYVSTDDRSFDELLQNVLLKMFPTASKHEG